MAAMSITDAIKACYEGRTTQAELARPTGPPRPPVWPKARVTGGAYRRGGAGEDLAAGPRSRRWVLMLKRTMLVGLVAVMAGACSSQSTTASTSTSAAPASSSSTTATASPETTSATTPPTSSSPEMSMAEALCSDLAKGLTPIQLYGGSVRELYPTPERFAVYVYGAVGRECPEQLRSNEPLRTWLQAWEINPDA